MPWGDFSYINIYIFVGVLKFEISVSNESRPMNSQVIKTPKGLYLPLRLIMEKPSILGTGKSYLLEIPSA